MLTGDNGDSLFGLHRWGVLSLFLHMSIHMSLICWADPTNYLRYLR